jgi:hypothetical protein
MIDKLKWFVAAVVAVFMTVLAVVYGKKTRSVLRAKVRAHNARGRVLNAEIKAADREAGAAKDEQAAQAFAAKADTLRTSREELQAERLRLLEETGDLEVNDAELANARNAGRSHSSVG